MGNDQPDIRRVGGLADLQKGGLLGSDVDRLFPEDHIHVAREAAHQMLRALKHEVPPQVRKTNEGSGFARWHRVLGFRRYWHTGANQHFPLSSVLLVAQRM